MGKLQNCALSVCSCKTQVGKLYCSEYCEQAASQGMQRDYCQCGHAGCDTAASADEAPDQLSVPESISFTAGRVVIQCSSIEHLREQIGVLSKALNDNWEALRMRVEAVPRRTAVPETPIRNWAVVAGA
jgi:hypothetical protein